jgi:NTP pyrophosphatase (non-canonical NTP hydrolase)
MEELAELTQATSKALRGKLNRENMTEEIADVLICIEMLKILYDIDVNDIQFWIDAKIERQKERDREIV